MYSAFFYSSLALYADLLKRHLAIYSGLQWGRAAESVGMSKIGFWATSCLVTGLGLLKQPAGLVKRMVYPIA